MEEVLNGAADSAAPPSIKTLDLAKSYGSTVALRSLTMSVGRGEIFGFLGPNGAGKTTAVKLLVGLSTASGGEAWVLDHPVGDVETRARIGYLPELFRYQDWLTGREVLELHCRLAKIPRAHRLSEIEHALSLTGLGERGHDKVGSYSKGMQQRLGLGVALLGKPEVVFLDEPTSALDPVGRHDVREIIRALKAQGVTVFLNSHLLSEVEQVCDRVAVVDKGRLIATGTLDDLRDTVKAVKIGARSFSDAAVSTLSGFGSVRFEGTTAVLSVDESRVPDVIRALVGVGTDILSIQPAATLEESFLNLLEASEHGHDGSGRPDAA